MNARSELAERKPQLQQPEAGRIGYKAFSWWTMMNAPTREQTRSRRASRGWRTMLMDAKP